MTQRTKTILIVVGVLGAAVIFGLVTGSLGSFSEDSGGFFNDVATIWNYLFG
jgi:hypothetical protein